MVKLRKKDKTVRQRGNEHFFRVGAILLGLLMILALADAHGAILASTPTRSPDISGVWAMLIIGVISWFFCAKGMPKDAPSFDDDGYLIEVIEEGGEDV